MGNLKSVEHLMILELIKAEIAEDTLENPGFEPLDTAASAVMTVTSGGICTGLRGLPRDSTRLTRLRLGLGHLAIAPLLRLL